MSQLKKLIEARRRSRSWENEARDAQGRWTDKDNQEKSMSAMGFAYAQAGLKNLIRRTKIREALRLDIAEKTAPKEVEKEVKKNTPVKIIGPLGRIPSNDPNSNEEELRTIGVKHTGGSEIELDNMQLNRLDAIRGGHHNLEEFLKSPPEFDSYLSSIYSGERVKMYMMSGGDIRFAIDGNFDANDLEGNIPSSELRDMTRAWLRLVKSNVGDRVFWNVPYQEKEGKDRFESRAKMYEKFGFTHPKKNKEGDLVMFLDNRKNKTKPLDPYYHDILKEKGFFD